MVNSFFERWFCTVQRLFILMGSLFGLVLSVPENLVQVLLYRALGGGYLAPWYITGVLGLVVFGGFLHSFMLAGGALGFVFMAKS